MLGVLQQINAVPGVMGCFLCDGEGGLTERAFSPLFDASMLEEAASTIADCAIAMEDSTGGLDLLDFRYSDLRVVVKAVSNSYLFLLCAGEINLQLLHMSVNVAAKKLDRLIAARQSQPVPSAPTAAPQGKASGTSTLVPVGRGLGLTIHLQKGTTSSTYWDNMLESVAINRVSSIQLSDHFKTKGFKKLKLTNLTTKTTKKFPVRVIKDDSEQLFDGKAIVSLAVMEALGVKQGDVVMAEIDIGGGFLGWEGI